MKAHPPRSIRTPAPDLLDRQFVAERPNQIWVADITYVPTWMDFLYLAVALDVWSRKIVGWAMESHLRTPLITVALDRYGMAFRGWTAGQIIKRFYTGVEIVPMSSGPSREGSSRSQ